MNADGLMARGARTDGAERDGGKAREKAVAAALCRNADFREWLYGTLDDLRGFERDEGQLTDFGQGIRAAAARMRDRLLVAAEAVDLLADLYRRNLKEDHDRLERAERKTKQGERE